MHCPYLHICKFSRVIFGVVRLAYFRIDYIYYLFIGGGGGYSFQFD